MMQPSIPSLWRLRFVALLCRSFVCGLLFVSILPRSVFAASEGAVFNAAARSFQLGAYDRARKEFNEFTQVFPESPKIPEAVLLQAIAAVKLSDGKQAASLLASNLPKAGVFAEQYRYWLGEAHLQASNYVAAADSFGRLVKDFPESPHVLEATYGEALARFRLKEWPRVVELLQPQSSPFQKLAQARPGDDLITRGFLLLAEALMEQKQSPDAESVLNKLDADRISAELKWQRQNLLCRIYLAERKLSMALSGSSNLVSLADAAASPALRAESIVLQGSILQQLDQPTEAAAAYEQNLRKEAPTERRRQALLKIIDLSLNQNAVDETAKKLERLLAEHPNDAGSDIARFTLGELRLKQYFAQSQHTNNAAITGTNAPPPLTNALQFALAQFEEILKNSPQSPVAGKAQLNRGWCLWESGKISESAAAFRLAAAQLPHSEDQAIARMKLGDAFLWQNDYSNALQNFRAVLTGYSEIPSVQRSLVPQALYHSLRCNIELTNLSEATDIMGRILRFHSQTPFAEKSVLLLGQQLSSTGQGAAARKLFSDFAERFPSSSLLPQVDLALARSHIKEKRWEEAIDTYDRWLDRYATNQFRPQAEFSRGWAYYQAGRDTNALTVFTNFLAEFPTNEFAPTALRWIADFYYRQSDFENAEKNYQLLFQNTNWPITQLTYEARMFAGKAAFARQSYKSAADYFGKLIEDNNCPPDLKAEAYFALGDTMIQQDPEPGKSLTQKFDEAKVAFKRIPDFFPTSPLVPLAYGAIANCYFQMAASDPKFYDNAKEEYQKVIALAEADVSTRLKAEIGLGMVLERQAHLNTAVDPENLLDAASDHYLNVLSGKTAADEASEIVLIKQAGLAAARLAEERKQWDMAMNIYNNLIEKLPSGRQAFQRKIDRIREQSRAESK
jgi:TolA-binding protein